MIWTLVCFGITFFVLRKFAFGPIQETIDERRERIRDLGRGGRARARRGAAAARGAPALIGQAKSEAGEILAEARKVAESQRERAREEIEADRQRRLEETRKQIDAETTRALEQIRAEVADLTLAATAKVTGKVLDREDHRRLIEDAIGDLDFSALERERASGRRAPHVRAGALRGRPGQGKLEVVHQELGDFVAAIARRARAAQRARNPELDPTAKAAVARARSSATPTSSCATSSCSSSRRAARREIEEIYRELDALVAAEQRRLNVELTTAFELSDEEADSILKKIEPRPAAASRRPARSTRADRRRRPPGRLAARRRERARPPQPPPPRTRRRRS